MSNEVRWLIEWFAAKGAPLPEDAAEVLENNYFEAGYLDSLAVIELITAAEEHFAIRFTETHFQERRFATVAGLAAIIRELRAAAG